MKAFSELTGEEIVQLTKDQWKKTWKISSKSRLSPKILEIKAEKAYNEYQQYMQMQEMMEMMKAKKELRQNGGSGGHELSTIKEPEVDLSELS